MRTLFVLLIACGAPELEPEPAHLLDVGGPVLPMLSVNGEPTADGGWLPTGVVFDARPSGWRLSCLNGAVPRFAAEGGAARMFCRLEVGL